MMPNRTNKQKLSGADALDMRDTIAKLREKNKELIAALEQIDRMAIDAKTVKYIVQNALAKAKG